MITLTFTGPNPETLKVQKVSVTHNLDGKRLISWQSDEASGGANGEVHLSAEIGVEITGGE